MIGHHHGYFTLIVCDVAWLRWRPLVLCRKLPEQAVRKNQILLLFSANFSSYNPKHSHRHVLHNIYNVIYSENWSNSAVLTLLWLHHTTGFGHNCAKNGDLQFSPHFCKLRLISPCNYNIVNKTRFIFIQKK